MIFLRFRIFAVLILSVGCPAAVMAQFSDTVHYYVNYASTGTINKVNEGTSYLLNNNFRFSIKKEDYTLNTANSWIYGKQLNSLSNNDMFAGLDFNWYKTIPHFYYWGLASVEKSYSLKINNRLQTGAGAGYNVFDRKTAEVIISDGLLYEKGDLHDSPETGSNAYEIVRNSLRLKFRFLIRDRVVIEGSDFLQHALSDKHDYIVKSNTTLSVKVKGGLSAATSVVYNKLSATRRENLLITYGIVFERYF